MKIQKLHEGQENQIANLRKDSVVKLFYPASVRDAIRLVTDQYESDKPMVVTHNLKSAAKLSDIVIQFWSRGRYLDAPPQIKKERNQELAKKEYPESFNPLVSLSLLSEQNPQALLTQHPLVSSIESVYVNLDGKMTKMSPRDFRDWFVKLVRRHREQGRTVEERLNERYNRSMAKRLLYT